MKKQKDKKQLLSIAIAFLAFAFLLIGILRGELLLILQKAAMVCLECVGIG